MKRGRLKASKKEFSSEILFAQTPRKSSTRWENVTNEDSFTRRSEVKGLLKNISNEARVYLLKHQLSVETIQISE